jgi:hypothetical protein
MVVCKNCASQSPDGTLYCQDCGSRIAPFSEKETKEYIASLRADTGELLPDETSSSAGSSSTMLDSAICTSCGYQGKPVTCTRGSFWIEVVLWICGILPGVIYTVWRLTTRARVCPRCRQPSMIPLNTPKGEELAKSYAERDSPHS